MYSTHNEGKAVVIERFNRTLKSCMWRHFTAQSKHVYIDALPKLLSQYNNTVHRSIGMTPTEASQSAREPFVQRPSVHVAPRPKFKIGDQVRVTVNKRHFEKGYTPNWIEEVFVVHDVQRTTPVTYRVRDLMDEPKKTTLTKFRIDKVLRKRRGQALVKWKGYPDKFNSWVPVHDLEKL